MPIPKEQLDAFGEALNQWTNYHHQRILINGIAQLSLSPVPAGWETSYWRYEFGSKQEESVKENRQKLKAALEKSTATPAQIEQTVQSMAKLSEIEIKKLLPEQLRQKIGTLGKIEFKPLRYSSD